MNLKAKATLVSDQLKKEYPTVETPLTHNNVFELLIATILSPQTNDVTTNMVTPALFEKYPTPEKLANADPEDVDTMIKLVNYHKTKSKHVVRTAQMLIDNFNSKVPATLEELVLFPGVGRKVANVIISEWYAKKPNQGDTRTEKYSTIKRGSILPEGFVIDTHVLRVSQRLGLTKHTDPKKVEQDLIKLFPQDEWNTTSLRMIFHGRNTCLAVGKNHKCCEHEFWSKMCNACG